MARTKKLGHGCTVSVAGTVFAKVRKFKPNKVSRSKTETTTFDDTVEQFLDSDPPNVGEIEFEAVWDVEDAEEALIDNLMMNDDISERETTVVFKIRKTGTGTPPAASTWTYTTITYTGRIEEIDPVEVDSKTLFARRIKLFLTGIPVKS
jgi:hypothetical protein